MPLAGVADRLAPMRGMKQTEAVIGPSLQEESDKLARSWMQHDAGMLRDYLVAGVEDPRLNVQSVLSRHFLAHALTGERFSALMEQEIRFAAAMNWLTALAGRLRDAEELELVLYALRRGADNAEGIEIPELHRANLRRAACRRRRR